MKRLIGFLIIFELLFSGIVFAANEQEYPVNPMILRDNGAVILSWKNPSELAMVSLRNLTDDKAVDASLPTAENETAICRIDGLENEKEYTFKVLFEYNGGSKKSIILSEKPSAFTPQVLGPWVFIQNVRESKTPMSGKAFVDREEFYKSGGGTASMRLSMNKKEIADNEYSMLYTETPLDAGTYKLSAKIKAQNASGISIYLGGWANPKSVAGSSPESYDWKDFSAVVTVNQKTSPGMFIVMSGSAEGFWIDDIKLTKIVNGTAQSENLFAREEAESIMNLQNVISVPDIVSRGVKNGAEIIWNNYGLEKCRMNIYDKQSGRLISSTLSDESAALIENLKNDEEHKFLVKTSNHYYVESEAKEISAVPQSERNIKISGADVYSMECVGADSNAFVLRGQTLSSDESVTVALYSGEELSAINETRTAANGRFEFRLNVPDGFYTMYINSASTGKIKGYLSASDYYETTDGILRMSGEVKKYIDLCGEKNIPTDYERIIYRIIERCAQYFKQDNDYGQDIYRNEQIRQLTELYNKAIFNLVQYLDGNKTPTETIRYKTGERTAGGNTFYAPTTHGRRPVYLTGYAADTEFVDYMHDLGMNYMHNEVLLRDVIRRGAAPYWTMDKKDSISISENRMNIISSQSNAVGQYVKLKPDTEYTFGISVTGDIQNGKISLGKESKSISGSGTYESTFKTGTDITEEYKLTFGGGNFEISAPYVTEKGQNENLLINSGFDMQDELFDGYTSSMKPVYEYEEFLKKAEQNDIAVSLNLGIHYIPDAVAEDDKNAASGMSPNPANPRYINAVEIYVRDLFTRIGNSSALCDVVIYNEPVYNASVHESCNPMWQNFLQNKYKDISAVNTAYGANYGSFEEISMPKEVSGEKIFGDYMQFNDEIMSELHHTVSEYIGKYTKAFRHTKVMQYIRPYVGGERLNKSNNYELWANAFDVNGCDAFSAQAQEEHIPLYAKAAWYDYMRSVKKAPVINSEDHVIEDSKNVSYSDKHEHITTDLWLGAVHGRGASASWVYDRKVQYMYFDKSFLNSNMTVRPYEQYYMGKAALDMNRLSDEIEMIADGCADTAILYSQNSLSQSQYHMNMICEAYKAVSQNGGRCEFISDERFEKIPEYGMIVLAGASRISDKMFAALKAYAENGGRLCIIGSETLKYDENGNARDEKSVNDLKAKSDCLSMNASGYFISQSAQKQLRDFVGKALLQHEITAEDAESGAPLEDVEYLIGNGINKSCISLCNYSGKTKKIKLFRNSEAITESKELIDGGDEGEIITLAPYGFKLLEISSPEYSLSLMKKENGAYTEKSGLTNGEWKASVNCGGSVPSGAVIAAAYYRNGNLISVKTKKLEKSDDEIYFEISDAEKGSSVSCMLWRISDMVPYSEKKEITVK